MYKFRKYYYVEVHCLDIQAAVVMECQINAHLFVTCYKQQTNNKQGTSRIPAVLEKMSLTNVSIPYFPTKIIHNFRLTARQSSAMITQIIGLIDWLLIWQEKSHSSQVINALCCNYWDLSIWPTVIYKKRKQLKSCEIQNCIDFELQRIRCQWFEQVRPTVIHSVTENSSKLEWLG